MPDFVNAHHHSSDVLAAYAFRAATLWGARAVGLAGNVGALRPEMAADLVLLDTSDVADVPFNSTARQVVYSEDGRGVRKFIVDGEVQLANGRLTRIDESAQRGRGSDSRLPPRLGRRGRPWRGRGALPP